MAFELPRLPLAGLGPEQFQIYWQKVVEAIEAQENAQNDILAQLAAAIADLQAVIRNDSITASYTAPGSVLTATDNGSNATIAIAAHKRVYGDGTVVNIAADSLTGNYATDYYIYYNDAARSDTTPNFLKTTNPNTALPNAYPGRHFVGKVTTPAAGAPATTGGTTPPTAAGTIDRSEIGSTL